MSEWCERKSERTSRWPSSLRVGVLVPNVSCPSHDHARITMTCTCIVFVSSAGVPTVFEMRRIKGVFLENLELDDFPVDVQDLSITVATERYNC